jgi:diguanylate cyclase (GGDEF)-like protein
LVNNLQADDGGFDHVRLWKRAAYGAAAARVLAGQPRADGPRVDPEEAMLAALLRDIGMLLLHSALGAEYDQALADAVKAEDILAREVKAFHANHAQIGAGIAGDWQLPEMMVEAIRGHHGGPTGDLAPDVAAMCDIVTAADACAETFLQNGDDAAEAAIVEARRICHARLHIGGKDTDELLTQIETDAKEVAALFEIELEEPTKVQAIMSQANEQLVGLSLASQAETQQEKVRAEELKQAATIDALTKLINRGEFDKRLAAALAEGPVALVMFDLDRFKSVNDTYGHAAGDAVLKQAATILQAVAKRNVGATAARLGGEEMAILLPGADRPTATRASEQFRQTLEKMPVKTEGQQLKVTTSAGVAAYEETGIHAKLHTPALLLKAADMALYHAKTGGRNRTKVFQLPEKKAA